jgi:hypothetical protein
MAGGSLQHRQCVIIGEENLEGVAGETDQLETMPEIEGSRIGFYPFDLRGAIASPRHLKHGRRRVGAEDRRNLLGDADGKHAGAAAEIENRSAGSPRQRQIEIVTRSPGIEGIVQPREIFAGENLIDRQWKR